ncbi:hypothetical protein AB3Y40_06820 [Yoonia sp. R2331]|uniref:hypothetical protein n=1 Tax=Yoonia sp. R2331 TaxID=3237238 RepID=UPI0034E6186A
MLNRAMIVVWIACLLWAAAVFYVIPNVGITVSVIALGPLGIVLVLRWVLFGHPTR